MKTMIRTILIAILLGSLSTVNAQTPAKPTTCETDKHFRDFDFWIGEWDVSSKSNNQFAGNNTIKPVQNGCALTEHWKSVSGGTGMSTNHYNPVTGKWRQLWISAGAYSLDIEGSFKDGAMRLEGKIWYYANNTSFPDKGTWTPNQNGSVRQLFEQFNPKAKTWDVWFDGIYTRSQKTKAPPPTDKN